MLTIIINLKNNASICGLCYTFFRMIITWGKDNSIIFTGKTDYEKGCLRHICDHTGQVFKLNASDDPVAGPIITFTPVEEKV
jgi:hypothetical protein